MRTLSWLLMPAENIQVPDSYTRLSTIWILLAFPNLFFTAHKLELNSLTTSTTYSFLNIQ